MEVVYLTQKLAHLAIPISATVAAAISTSVARRSAANRLLPHAPRLDAALSSARINSVLPV